MTGDGTRIIKVIIADDHELFADGLEQILNEHPYRVVGKVTNGKLLLQLLNNVTPDLILLDINMDIMNGIETAILIKKQTPYIKIIFISMEYDSCIKTIIEKNCINGFLPKTINAVKFREALSDILKGNSVFIFPNEIVNSKILSLSTNYQFFSQFKLTRTEIEIISLISKGDSTKIIALKKKLSHLTIETHRKNIFRKIDAKNMAEVVAFAYKHKLIE